MSIECMRKKIMDVYSGVAWKDRCIRMPDNQVIAVYYSFLNNGRFEKKKPAPVQEYHQYDLFEMGLKV